MQGYGIPAPAPNMGVVADMVQANNAALYDVIMTLLQPMNAGIMRGEHELATVIKPLKGAIKRGIKQCKDCVGSIATAVSGTLASGYTSGATALGTVLDQVQPDGLFEPAPSLGGWEDPSTGINLSQDRLPPPILHEAPHIVTSTADTPKATPKPPSSAPPSCEPGYEFVPDDKPQTCQLFKLCPANDTIEQEAPYVPPEDSIPGIIPGGNNAGDLPEPAELFELNLLEEYDSGSLPG